jgi:hypothetical protein
LGKDTFFRQGLLDVDDPFYLHQIHGKIRARGKNSVTLGRQDLRLFYDGEAYDHRSENALNRLLYEYITVDN